MKYLYGTAVQLCPHTQTQSRIFPQVLSVFLTLYQFVCFVALRETALAHLADFVAFAFVQKGQLCFLNRVSRVPQRTEGTIVLEAVSSDSHSITFTAVSAPVNC